MTLPIVHPERPEVDGFCFSEIDSLNDSQVRRMCKTGNVYITEFKGLCDGRVSRFTGTLIAPNMEEAEQEAKRRGLGEVISGVLHSQISEFQ